MIGRPQGSPWSRWVGAFSDALPGGHLSLDAVVAHVDGELPTGPASRAAAHVDRCPACAGEVMAQRQARRRL
ncbi:MAG TPA: zf-HC2 domain-containing protein, partial [Actinomycetospora sp.]|uniref:zf-HC2 domain-containing protein n=1 Tax=Actinomycetospora sp. TaxID=1872135 RepID=UPI002F3FB10B